MPLCAIAPLPDECAPCQLARATAEPSPPPALGPGRRSGRPRWLPPRLLRKNFGSAARPPPAARRRSADDGGDFQDLRQGGEQRVVTMPPLNISESLLLAFSFSQATRSIALPSGKMCLEHILVFHEGPQRRVFLATAYLPPAVAGACSVPDDSRSNDVYFVIHMKSQPPRLAESVRDGSCESANAGLGVGYGKEDRRH